MALVSYPLIRVLILTGIKPDTYQPVKPWLWLDLRLEKFFGEPFFGIIILLVIYSRDGFFEN